MFSFYDFGMPCPRARLPPGTTGGKPETVSPYTLGAFNDSGWSAWRLDQRRFYPRAEATAGRRAGGVLSMSNFHAQPWGAGPEVDDLPIWPQRNSEPSGARTCPI